MTRTADVSSYDNLLLAGAWLPVTAAVLFANASAERCADAFVNGVRGSAVVRLYGSPLKSTRVTSSSLEGILSSLLPLELGNSRRNLIVPTANAEWSAIFDSTWRGQDPQSAMTWLTVSGIESVSVTDIPYTRGGDSGLGLFGVRKIEMYELDANGERIGHSLGVRMVSERRWEVVQPSGEFPVGNVWDPTARRVSERFTHSHLVKMTARFGLRPFDDDFYAPDGEAILVERTDPIPADEVTFTLDKARYRALTD